MSTQVPIIIWLNAGLIILTIAAICSRVGRRVFVIGKFSWHDTLITLAAVSATIFSIFQMIGTRYGLGYHQSDVDEAQMPVLVKLIMTSNVFYFLCNWAVKHALLLFYVDITTSRAHLISIYFMHFVAFGFGLSSILVNLFQCRPFNKAWRPNIPGFCVNLNLFFYCNAAIMMATDIVLYIMPVIFTRRLQLKKAQRVGLYCLFALGGLVVAVSAVRMYSVHLFATKPDFAYRFANAMIYSVVENHLAIVVACAPSVKVVALLIFPRLTSSLRSVVSRASTRRSRASIPFDMDLESGSRRSDKLRITPANTPMPSPAFTGGRASQGFAEWFKWPKSPVDSTEDCELVNVRSST